MYKELERLISLNKISMSVDNVLDAAKTITTIRIKMPENGTFFTKTLFLTEKHLTIRPLFELYESKFQLGNALTKSGELEDIPISRSCISR